jgi:uncharacterized protein (DUF58 family)
VSPTRRAALLAGLVALAAFALPVPPAWWIAALAVLLGAAGADAVMAGRRPGVHRELATSLVRGVPSSLSVEVRPRANRAWAGVRYLVRQPLPAELRADPSEGPAPLRTTVIASVRGRHILPPVAVRAIGPLGLARRDHRAGGAREVQVFPDLPGARVAAARRRAASRREDGRVRAMLGLGTELESVRDYAPDDDVRRVNWHATGRVGRPMTNQYRVERDREVLFLVDSGRLMSAPVGDATRLDLALDALAAVAVAAEARGDRAGAIVFADTLRRELAPRRRGAEGLVLGLADLQTVETDSDYLLAFHRAADRKRAIVVVLTDLLDDSASRHLVEAAPVLARRHPVVVASVRDPDLHDVLTTPPQRAVDVMEMAVALDVVAGRDRVVAGLERYGAFVVDRPPDRLASACVAAYLTIKSRALA